MRNEFAGYYAPTEQEYKKLWNDGLIIIDTNVLLDLYRLPTSARDDLFTVLDLINDRLWIPYQVALEFQRRRLVVISSERKATEEALSEASRLFERVKETVAALQIDRRGLGIQPDPLINDLKIANDKLIEALSSVHSAQLDISSSDPVRDRLDQLLSGRVGPAPSDQPALDCLIEEGQIRYENKIPPGFADTEKDKNPAESVFYHDGILYQRKFGDLIIWRQILNKAKEDHRNSIMFVTADRKDDWWWREKGKTIGPRPELIREMRSIGQIDLFWMYSSAQFLEHATKFVKAHVSASSVTELKEVIRAAWQSPTSVAVAQEIKSAIDANILPNRGRAASEFAKIEQAVVAWLKWSYDFLLKNEGFPDFIVNAGLGTHGFDIVYARHITRPNLTPPIINSILRGYIEMNEGRLSDFTIVIVVDRQEMIDVVMQDGMDELSSRLDALLLEYPVSELVIGSVDPFEDFRSRGQSAR